MTYLSPNSFDIWMAEQVILGTYGDTVSVAAKKKTLLKFGRRDNVGTTYRTLWNMPGTADHEAYPTTNAITHFASSDAGDTGSVAIEGHTVSGTGTSAEFTFVTQTVTLAGQTKTALTTPLARVNRVYNPTATEWLGSIYVAQDVTFTGGVPTVDSAVHMRTPAASNQSQKCATTISNLDYWIVTAVAGSILQKTSEFADLRLEVREVGGVFRERFNFAVSSSGGPTTRFEVYPPLIVPKNADIRMVAESGSANTIISAWINGYLAAVQV